MTYLETVLLVAHLIVAAAVCGFVLMQHGKGADMGAAFGSGSSGSLFGAAGSANFLSRTTAILATVFFLTSVGLTFFGSIKGRPSGVMDQGVMERMAPAAPKAAEVPKPADVPQPSGSAPASSVPQPAQNTPAQAVPAPAAPAGGTDKKGEVPK
ncbi:MAG TPA: preprotein translocase subunit SecG [Casimicrobiaceae bacterium]|nr:preprotein translocase subunit SecG [Casimicrobiaceae bacterium]